MRQRCVATAMILVLAVAGVGCGDDGGGPGTPVDDGGIQNRELPTVGDRES